MATLADFSSYMDAARTALQARDSEAFTLQITLAETVAAELADRGDIDGTGFGFSRLQALKQLKQSAQSVFGADVQFSTVEFRRSTSGFAL